MYSLKGKDIVGFFTEKAIDTFIVSSSFESRCFAIANNLVDFNFRQSIVCKVIDFNSKLCADNCSLLREKLNSSISLQVSLKISDPIFSFFELAKSIVSIFKDEPKKVAIDITNFTHESLLIIYRILETNKRDDDVLYFCYNGAKEYSINEDDRNSKWLTKGVREIRSIIGYPGYSDPSQKNHLMILFGFERERTIRLIDEFEYDTVSLAFGSREDSMHPAHQSINEERHAEILSLYSNANKFIISLTDPETTKQEILQYASKFENDNIVLAPMNNKVSTIGAGMAAIENKNIQLCYLQPNQYNVEGYSEPGDSFYIWEKG